MTSIDRTLLISTALVVAAMLAAYGAVAAACAGLMALYIRETTLRSAATSALRKLAGQLEYEAAARKRLEDIIESRFMMNGLASIFTDDRSVH